jgi:AcrR family transcriptional regulator
MTGKETRRPDQLPPGRHNLPREYVAESQRSRILRGAIEAVAELGYQDARVTDIVARAGVSRKTFYNFFDEKESCVLAAYDIEVARLTDAASQAFYGSGQREWPVQLRDGLRALLRHMAEDPAAARVCIVDVAAVGPAARGKRDTALRNFTYFIDAGRGLAQHEVPGRTALGVIGGIVELIAAEIVYGSTAQLEHQLAPDAVYLATLPFLGPAGATEQRDVTRRELAADTTRRTQLPDPADPNAGAPPPGPDD